MHTTKWDSKVLVAAGAGLLLMAGFFLWRDLQVQPHMLIALAAIGAAAATTLRLPRAIGWLGPTGLILAAATGGAWYAMTREPVLIVALGVATGASLLAVFRTRGQLASREDRVPLVLTWYGMAIAAIATSAALYFHYVTLDLLADQDARRFILTFAWLATGGALVLYARRRGDSVIRDAGFLFLAAAVLKAIGYDTVNLAGFLRIGLLAGAGAALTACGVLANRVKARTEVA